MITQCVVYDSSTREVRTCETGFRGVETIEVTAHGISIQGEKEFKVYPWHSVKHYSGRH